MLCQTEGVSICPHKFGCPLYVWMPPYVWVPTCIPCMFRCNINQTVKVSIFCRPEEAMLDARKSFLQKKFSVIREN